MMCPNKCGYKIGVLRKFLIINSNGKDCPVCKKRIVAEPVLKGIFEFIALMFVGMPLIIIIFFEIWHILALLVVGVIFTEVLGMVLIPLKVLEKE